MFINNKKHPIRDIGYMLQIGFKNVLTNTKD